MNKSIPLNNVSLFEFTRRVVSAGKISLKGVLLLPLYYIQMMLALPFALLQHLLWGQQIKNTVISKDPLFILGHYRSGTTLLHKLMASDKQFGFLTNYDSLFPNINLLLGKQMQPLLQQLINTFKIRNPFFNNTIVQLSEPCEEDDYLMNKASGYSAYWGLVFPKRWREWLNGTTQFRHPGYYQGWKKEYLQTIKYATFKNQGKQLVLKNPPNTERINLLLQLFPQAKFVYIYRNPYHLYYSTKSMWKNAILGYYSVQKISDEELDDIVFDHFSYLTDKYENDRKLISRENLMEISYERLKSDPFNTVRQIYSGLNLPGFEKTVIHLMNQIEKEKEYRNFRYEYDEQTKKRIEEKWGKYIRQWHYTG